MDGLACFKKTFRHALAAQSLSHQCKIVIVLLTLNGFSLLEANQTVAANVQWMKENVRLQENMKNLMARVVQNQEIQPYFKEQMKFLGRNFTDHNKQRLNPQKNEQVEV